MPIISSISGTYGFGRSPQTAPTPGITIYPPLGTKKTWNFTSNGAFVFEANSITNAGTCYVITPNANFTVNVKIWGAGGGTSNAGITSASTVNLDDTSPASGSAAPVPAGTGGLLCGQLMLQAGQPYTIFAGGAGASGYTVQSPTVFYKFVGGGGAASGILSGNIFLATTLPPAIAIAGGGGGASALSDNSYILSSAGGGSGNNLPTRSSTNRSVNYLGSDTNGIFVVATQIEGTSGLPITVPLSYSGGVPSTGSSGGGGGFRGGRANAGGLGNVSIEQPDMRSVDGLYNIAPYYDDSTRGTAGDSDHSGRVMIYLDEYKAANIVATGGTITSESIPGAEFAYKYHTFTTNGTFTVTSADKADSIDVFVVGGGGGGAESGAGGGGGGIAFRSNLNISAGTYLVDVGAGGSKSDTYGASKYGGIYGGYKGSPSAFYTNHLVSKGFPNNYVKLINSFGGKIKYINSSGDNTDGLSFATGYTSFNSALTKNKAYLELIVFVVLQGTYAETVSLTPFTTVRSSPVYDENLPRIFVCAPNKVTIEWSISSSVSNSLGDYWSYPMCSLSHPMSAIYGAIFSRNGYKAEDTTPANVSKLAFFQPMYVFTSSGIDTYKMRGSVYNCAFKEATGDWGLVNSRTLTMGFKIENCTFVSPAKEIAMTTDGTTVLARKAILKNCIIQKSLTSSVPTLNNTAQDATVASKYVVTAHPDKGVYAGEYSWSGTTTAPAASAKLLTIVGHGGGGGTDDVFLGLAHCAGGSGGGTSQFGERAPSTQYNKEANADYSCYGYAGGAKLSNVVGFTGGGGAGYPGENIQNSTQITAAGGVGIEFPTNSGVYYGTGGSTVGTPARQLIDTTQLAPGNVGRGGNGGTNDDANGSAGIVIVRYLVPGPYVIPSPSTLSKNIIAYGGTVSTTATYKQHVFTTAGTFDVAQLPTDAYIDIILVGGGGGGAMRGYYQYSGAGTPREGGYGGSVVYQRIFLKSTRLHSVIIGSGAPTTTSGYFEASGGGVGGNSQISLDDTTLIAYGGGGGGFNSSVANDGAPGVKIVNGLFSDNTTYYSGGGAPGKGSEQYLGGIGGGGSSGGSGTPNTGGGGGGSIYTQFASGGSGGSGIVIIRYPIVT